MLFAGEGLAEFAFDPLPDLSGPGGVDENDEVLVAVLGDFSLNLAPGGIVGQALTGLADKGDKTPLLGDGLKVDLLAGHGQGQVAGGKSQPSSWVKMPVKSNFRSLLPEVPSSKRSAVPGSRLLRG